MGTELGTAYISLIPETKNFAAAIGAQTAGPLAKAGGMGGALFGGGLVSALKSAAIPAAFMAIGGLSMSAASTIKGAYNTIRVGTGDTGKELEGLKADFRNVFMSVPGDAESAGKAIAGFHTRLGVTGPALRNLSRQALELSRITKSDLGENVRTVTRVFGDWSIKQNQMSSSMDWLFKVSQQTGISVGELSDTVVRFGAPLRMLGFTFKQSTAMLGKWEKEGVNVGTALAGLRFSLKYFSKQGVDSKKGLVDTIATMKKLGKGTEATALASKIFGLRAGPDMAAAILEGRFEVDKLMASIAGGSDTIMKAADDTKGFAATFDQLKNIGTVILAPLGQTIYGVLTPALKDVTELAKGFAEALGSGKGVDVAAGKLGAKLGELVGQAMNAPFDIISTMFGSDAAKNAGDQGISAGAAFGKNFVDQLLASMRQNKTAWSVIAALTGAKTFAIFGPQAAVIGLAVGYIATDSILMNKVPFAETLDLLKGPGKKESTGDYIKRLLGGKEMVQDFKGLPWYQQIIESIFGGPRRGENRGLPFDWQQGGGRRGQSHATAGGPLYASAGMGLPAGYQVPGLASVKTQTQNTIAGLISGILASIGSLPGKVATFVGDMAQRFLARVTALKTSALPAIGELVSGAVSWIAKLPGTIARHVGWMAQAFINRVIALKYLATIWFKNLVTSAVNTISSLPGKFSTYAGRVISGFVNGISDGVDRIAKAGRNLASALIRAVKDFLHIKSPSGVFAGIGSNVVAGLVKGLNFSNAIGLVKKFFGGVWGFASNVPSILGDLFASGDVGSLMDMLSNVGSIPGKLGRAVKGLVTAYAQVGKDYVWGGLDCSGLASMIVEAMDFDYGRFTTATVPGMFAPGPGKYATLGWKPGHMGIEVLGKWFEAKGKKWGILGPGSARKNWQKLFHIPGFEKGGLSTGPTSGYPVILHGAEYIIPKNQLAVAGASAAGGMNFNNCTFPINVPDGLVSTFERNLARKVRNSSDRTRSGQS